MSQDREDNGFAAALGVALRVRSDVERKRLAGIAATDHGHTGIGRRAVRRRHDASHLRATGGHCHRDRRCRVSGYRRCDVSAPCRPPDVSRVGRATWRTTGDHLLRSAARDTAARVAARVARGTDASDATLEVLTHQLSVFETPADDEKTIVQLIDTDTDPQMLQARCEAIAAILAQ